MADGGASAVASVKEAVKSEDFGTFSMKGKTAVVTGGGSGIGRAICLLLARRGAAVCVLDVNDEGAKETVDLMGGGGGGGEDSGSGSGSGSGSWHHCDVTSGDDVDRVFAEIVSLRGRVDVVVNNAGIGSVGTVLETTTAEMDKLYAVNVKGVFHCLRAAVRVMLADEKGGSIVNVGSIASVVGLADRFAYSCTKGAVLTMSKSVATDYVKRGIRSNCVCPARVHTPFVDAYLAKAYAGKEEEKFKELSEYQPVGRMGQPEEVAALVLFLASDEAKFITGAEYMIDGGVAAVM